MKRLATSIAICMTTALGLAAAYGQPMHKEGPGEGMPGGPGGMEDHFGPGIPLCARFLMHSHPVMLKEKFGLTDVQLKEVESTRTQFLTRSIAIRSQIEQNQVKMVDLFQADKPDEKAILDLERKNLSLRGQIAEDAIKAHLKFVRLLSKEQRDKLRNHCHEMMMMHEHGMGRGSHGMMPGGHDKGSCGCQGHQR